LIRIHCVLNRSCALASAATLLREQALNRRNWTTAIMGSPTVIYHPAVAHFLRYIATTGKSLPAGFRFIFHR
jgi:hypothetical protein